MYIKKINYLLSDELLAVNIYESEKSPCINSTGFPITVFPLCGIRSKPK